MLHAQISRTSALFCALVSGLLGALAFNGFGVFCAWFCFVPLLFVLSSDSLLKTKLLSSFVFSLLFHSLSLYWVGYVSVVGLITLCLCLSVYVLFFALGSHLALRLHRFCFFIAVPFLWCAVEKVQELFITAFPWLKLAYTVVDFSALAQIAAFTSASGLSFLVVLANVSLLAFVLYFLKTDSRDKKQMLIAGTAGAVFIVLVSVVGFGLLSEAEKSFESGANHGSFRIAGIQGNRMPDIYGGGTMEDVEESLEIYKNMTIKLLESPAGLGGIDLVVWPETAVPADFRYWLTYFKTVHNLSEKYKVPFVVGSSDEKRFNDRDNQYTNTAFLYDSAKGLVSRYDKMKLVPFGEFLPFKAVFGWMRRFVFIPPDMTPGRACSRFKLSPWAQDSCGVLICFEDMFPELARMNTQNGAGFLLNITHDGWFKKSCAALQHRDGARLRAIENRRALLRVTLSGVSCLIDPTGRVVDLISVGDETVMVRGAKVFNIEKRWLTQNQSFYTRHGDLLGAGSLIFAILIFIISARFRPRP